MNPITAEKRNTEAWIEGKACLVPLQDGAWAKVSPRDYARVMEHKWCKVRPTRETYKVRMFRPHETIKGKMVTGIALHRFILDAEPGDYVRFINKDGLDCRRANLWVIYRTNKKPIVKPVKLADRPRELPSPCGGMLSARSMTRCHGFQPTGDSDGCPYYEQCLDAAAHEHWAGWRSVHGSVSTAQWANADGLQDFLRSYKHQQKSGRYGG